MSGLNHVFAQGVIVGDRVADKMEPIHDRIFVQRAGVSAHTRAVQRYLRSYVKSQYLQLGSLPSVRAAAGVLHSIIRCSRLEVSMICSGWDPYEGY